MALKEQDVIDAIKGDKVYDGHGIAGVVTVAGEEVIHLTTEKKPFFRYLPLDQADPKLLTARP